MTSQFIVAIMILPHWSSNVKRLVLGMDLLRFGHDRTGDSELCVRVQAPVQPVHADRPRRIKDERCQAQLRIRETGLQQEILANRKGIC